MNHSLSYRTQYTRLWITRRAAEVLLTALLVAGGMQLALTCQLSTPLFTATGVGLTAIYLRGVWCVLGILLGTVVSLSLAQSPLAFTLLFSATYTLGLWGHRVLSLRLLGALTPLPERAEFTKLTAFTALYFIPLVGLLKASEQLIGVNLNGLAFWQSYFAHLGGVICLMPFCLVLNPFSAQALLRSPPVLALSIGLLIAVIPLMSFWPLASDVTWLMLSGALFMGYSAWYGPILSGLTLLGLAVSALTIITPYHIYPIAYLQLTVLFVAMSLAGLYLAFAKRVC